MKNILSLLPKIGIALLFLLMAGMTIMMGYIMFAPDTWPKPFYLVYYDDTEVPEEGEAATPEGEEGAQPPSEGGAAGENEPVSGAEQGEVPSAPIEIRPGQGLMVDTGTKIVNLIDPTGRKYLRVGIVLEFAPTELAYYTMPAEEKTTFVTSFTEDVNSKLPVINDIIITKLASQTFESVYTAEGKENLRKELQETINTQLPEYRVIFVYFTEFVVQ